MLITVDEYTNLAKWVIDQNDLEVKRWMTRHYNRQFIFDSRAITPKERPRTGKGGHMFTPKKTRELEADIAEYAKDYFAAPVTFPLRVRIEFRDATKDKALIHHSRNFGLTYNDKKDLDNMGKLVLDALNGIMYKDDKQIVHLTLTRVYAHDPGCMLTVWRHGLNKFEYANFKKFIL